MLQDGIVHKLSLFKVSTKHL